MEECSSASTALSYHTQARFPFKRNHLRCVNENRKKRLRFLRFSFTQRTQRKRLRLNGNRALDCNKYRKVND